MSNALTISFPVEAAIEKIKQTQKKFDKGVDDILNANATDIATKAKQLAPVDMGGLRSAISADNSKPLEKHITVNAFYAAFIEFGTGKYAAQYVSTLPSTWSEYARNFKGQKGGGSFDEFLLKIMDWVKRKGLSGTYSVKTQKRTGKKGARDFEDAEVAYFIAIAIIKKGVHPHPFLFPAYEQQRPEIVKEIESFLKSLWII